MQFLVLALASLAIATPVIHERSASNALVGRQQNAYAGYYPNSHGSGNSGDGNGNSGSGNGNSGNGSGNGNGNSGKGDNGNGNGSGNGSGNGNNNNGGGFLTPGRPNTNPTSPTIPTIPANSVNPCNGLADTPQCCSANVLGLIGLDCDDVPDTITSRDNFIGQCSSQGRTAQCCLLPLLEQGLICGGALN